MKLSKLFGFIGLGIIAALLILVVIFSFVTVNLSFKISTNEKLESSVAVAPTQITISKYDGETSTKKSYKLFYEDGKTDYYAVLENFNKLGNFTIMQKLFLGISSDSASLNQETTKTFSELQREENGYLIEMFWTEEQALRNPDGSVFKNKAGNQVRFTKLAIFVDNSNKVSDQFVYVKNLPQDTQASEYHYTICANTKSLFDMASDFDQSGKIVLD